MTPLYELWLPVILSAALVFVVSSVLHMFTPWHKTDFEKIPNESRVLDALRPFAIPPGNYMAPRADSMEHMRTPEFKEKYRTGPVILLTVCPSGNLSMVRNLVGWFVYCCVVGLFAGGIAGSALGKGAPYLAVFHFVSLTAFAGYALALWQASIWLHRAWLTTIKSTVDGLLFALLTGGVFGWLWPH